MKNFLPFLLLLAACGQQPGRNPSLPPRLFADGGSVGNGGDDRPLSQDSAWFLGRRAARYCIRTARDFGVADDVIKQSVAHAIDQWRTYLLTQGLTHSWQFTETRLPGGAPELVLNTHYLDRCDGSQDLTFYMGGDEPQVRAARERNRYANPLAFAERTSYDIHAGWGGGFVWVQSQGRHSRNFPHWESPGALEATLLHEIGHVLGCAHVGGTIMDRDIVQLLRLAQGNPFPARIDTFRSLLAPTTVSRFLVEGDSLTLFPISMFSARGPVPRDKNRSLLELAGSGDLRVRDGARSFLVVGLREISRIPGDAPVFKMAYRETKSLLLKNADWRTEAVTYTGDRWAGNEADVAYVHFNGDQFRLRVQVRDRFGEVTELLQF